MNRVIIFLILCSLFSSCKTDIEYHLEGRWNGIELAQADSIINVDFSKVHLTFNPNGKYEFYSTLNYVEKGVYIVKKDKNIFLKSTDNPKPKENMLKIDYLQNDTLVLLMNYKGHDQILTLVKGK
jgi:hypothetical protein